MLRFDNQRYHIEVRIQKIFMSSEELELHALTHTKPQTFGTRGLIIGLIAMIALWVLPVPVAAFVWIFGIERPFVDVMVTMIPIYIAMPVVGAVLGSLVRRPVNRDERTDRGYCIGKFEIRGTFLGTHREKQL
jgi:hypothetical protein